MSTTIKFSNGDMVVDRNKGRAFTITGNQKLAQDIAYFLMSADDEIRNTGSKLKNIERQFRQNSLPGDAARVAIMDAIQTSMGRLRSWQEQTGNLSPGESLQRIETLNVVREDATAFLAMLAVMADTEDVLPQSYRISLAHQFVPNTEPGVPGFSTDDNR